MAIFTKILSIFRDHWVAKSIYLYILYIYIEIYTYMHACMHTYIHTYIHTSIHPYIHPSIHTYIHIHIYTSIFCIHLYNYPSHIYVCVYIYIYKYNYGYICSSLRATTQALSAVALAPLPRFREGECGLRCVGGTHVPQRAAGSLDVRRAARQNFLGMTT